MKIIAGCIPVEWIMSALKSGSNNVSVCQNEMFECNQSV